MQGAWPPFYYLTMAIVLLTLSRRGESLFDSIYWNNEHPGKGYLKTQIGIQTSTDILFIAEMYGLINQQWPFISPSIQRRYVNS